MTDKALILLTIRQHGGLVHRQRLPFAALPATIGRAPDNTLRLPHQTLSQHHLLLDTSDTHLLVLDNRKNPPVPLTTLPLESDDPADFTAGGLDFTIAIARDAAALRKALEDFAGMMTGGEGDAGPANVPSDSPPDTNDPAEDAEPTGLEAAEPDGFETAESATEEPANAAAEPAPDRDGTLPGTADVPTPAVDSQDAGAARAGTEVPEGSGERSGASAARGSGERLAAIVVALVAVTIVLALVWWFVRT